jgi:hypothetical protein
LNSTPAYHLAKEQKQFSFDYGDDDSDEGTGNEAANWGALLFWSAGVAGGLERPRCLIELIENS